MRRLKQGTLADFGDLPLLEAAKKIALLLDDTVLPIQGPPGSGKTFTMAKVVEQKPEEYKAFLTTAGMAAVGECFPVDAVDRLRKNAAAEMIPIVEGKRHADASAIQDQL